MTQTPKERLQEAWESGKKAVKGLVSAVGNATSSVRNTLKAGYQAVDAWDKAIWNAIEKKMEEKSKNTKWKFWKIVRENILKALLWIWVITGTGVYVDKVVDDIKDKKDSNKEIAIDNKATIVQEIFDNQDVMTNLEWNWKQWQDKWYNNYLWNNEAWNTMRSDFWIKERKKVIEWFCRMVESWDIDMIFEKADEAWVPRQCIFLALAESWWQAWANSWVAWWYWQFTRASAEAFWLIDDKWNDYRADKEKSTQAAMRHLKENYDIVSSYDRKLWYNMTERDKWMFSFYMYNWSPKLVKKWIIACKWKADNYPNMQTNTENRNYVSRILWIQDALEEIFKENDYDIKKVKETENMVSMHEKTVADDMYEQYQKQSSWLSVKKKIEKLNEIKWQYQKEYNDKQISQKYYEWAISIINDDIESLKNSD